MRRFSRVDSIVSELAADIITGRAEEGTALPTEPSLCNQFFVSRTVIREAMVRLSHMGLVRVRQGFGTYVQSRENWNGLDPELLRIRAETGLIGDLIPDLLQIRRIVEVEVAGCAAQLRSDDHLVEMAKLIEAMSAARHDPNAYTAADVGFHDLLIVASGNELLRQMMRPIHQIRLIGSVITATSSPAVVEASLFGHREIFTRIAERDHTRAREAMSRHISQFERDISDAIMSGGLSPLNEIQVGTLGSTAPVLERRK